MATENDDDILISAEDFAQIKILKAKYDALQNEFAKQNREHHQETKQILHRLQENEDKSNTDLKQWQASQSKLQTLLEKSALEKKKLHADCQTLECKVSDLEASVRTLRMQDNAHQTAIATLETLKTQQAETISENRKQLATSEKAIRSLTLGKDHEKKELEMLKSAYNRLQELCSEYVEKEKESKLKIEELEQQADVSSRQLQAAPNPDALSSVVELNIISAQVELEKTKKLVGRLQTAHQRLYLQAASWFGIVFMKLVQIYRKIA